MRTPIGRSPFDAWALHLVAVILGVALTASPALGQAGWREAFAAGEEARAEGDDATYAREMARAVELMEPGLLNRPFAQYHAARAQALLGARAQAVGFLHMAWEEEIESLMISFAAYDPAFDGMRGDPGLRALLDAPSRMELRTTSLSGPVHLVEGAGSAVLASVGEDGVLLVDTGYRPALPALRRALAGVGGEDVDVVVLTHPHEDHWGAVEEFGVAATVLAHPGTADAMDEPYTFIEGVVLPPKGPSARPDHLVRDTAFAFNGERVRILPVEAHTGADIAVHFEGSRVVHFGDAYLGGNPMMFPGGEDPDGFLDRLEAFLDGISEETLVVGGHDPPTDVAAVRAQVEATRACMALVRSALAAGRSLEETVRRAEGRFTAPWVSYFYRALSG